MGYDADNVSTKSKDEQPRKGGKEPPNIKRIGVIQMRLVYDETGKEVKLGDKVTLKNGKQVTVTYFAKPHSPASSGKVTVRTEGGGNCEYYVSVIGAKWIEREDRGEEIMENKVQTVKNLETLVKAMDRSAVKSLEYQITETEEEFVIITFNNGYKKSACVTADSELAMCIDTLKVIY